jgi:hypothetical protein
MKIATASDGACIGAARPPQASHPGKTTISINIRYREEHAVNEAP